MVNMTIWSQHQLSSALETEVLAGSYTTPVNGISIDSRSVNEGDLFICIRGENNDGHRFINDALNKGASGILADEKSVEEGTLEPDEWSSSDQFLFVVPDTLRALIGLARYRRSELKGYVIGVTGSSGKTSSRDILLSIADWLEPGKSHGTRGNLNNHIGLPLSLARIPPDSKLTILEMGMNHPGEIHDLSLIARPHISMITSISGAHMEFFQSVADIARAKLEILDGMDGGSLIFNGSSPGVEEAKSLCNERGIEGRFYRFVGDPGGAGTYADDRDDIELPPISSESPELGLDLRVRRNGISFHWLGQTIENRGLFQEAFAWNLLGACNTFLSLGYDPGRICEGARKASVVTARRFQVVPVKRGGHEILLVDDSYNANPDSFRKSLYGLRELIPHGKIALAAGEMAELGQSNSLSEHKKIGELAASLGYEIIGVCGNRFISALVEGYRSSGGGQIHGIYESSERMLEDLSGLFDKEKELDGILVKGSRSSRMDLISDAIKEYGNV